MHFCRSDFYYFSPIDRKRAKFINHFYEERIIFISIYQICIAQGFFAVNTFFLISSFRYVDIPWCQLSSFSFFQDYRDRIYDVEIYILIYVRNSDWVRVGRTWKTFYKYQHTSNKNFPLINQIITCSANILLEKH